MLDKLKRDVHEANMALAQSGLVTGTSGNASGVDREAGVVVIKPSGVPYDKLTPERLAVISLADGARIGGDKPSTDTAAHLELYRAFPDVGGVVHAHSCHAVMFAQALRAVPCLGTTHADAWRGDIPVTRPLTASEIESDYEAATGRSMVECLGARLPLEVPGALAAHHGPFAWGRNAGEAVQAAVTLEQLAMLAWGTFFLSPERGAIPKAYQEKHYNRKHGPGAYYGSSI